MSFSVGPHKKWILFITESNFRRQKRLSDEINVIENFEKIVVSLKEKSNMFITIGV